MKTIKTTIKLRALVIVFGALLSVFISSSAYAEAVPSTLTMNISTDNVHLDLTPEINGKFGKSENATISINTNNFSGYTLGIATTTTTYLEDGAGNTIPTLAQAISEQDFSTSAAYNNMWGYKPSKLNSVANTNYLPAPSTSGAILDVTDEANAENNTYTIGLGARADYTVVNGNYKCTVVITAVANDIVYNITYDENTEDEVENMPEDNPQVVTIDGGSLQSTTTLSDATPTRVGHDFMGWCDEATTLDAIGNQICGGTTYDAGDTYGIDQTADGSNIVLHAIWQYSTYSIPLDQDGASTTGSTSAVATYGQTTLAPITVPQRAYTISKFVAGTNASDAIISSQATLTSTYTLDGWYQEQEGVHKIASADPTPVLEANTDYTDSEGRWVATSAHPLYAKWNTPAAKTLPSITKEGYNCGWSESQSASTYTYGSGDSLNPARDYELYGICVPIDYTITVRTGNGISALALNGWTASGTNLTKTYHVGDTIDLSAFNKTYKTGYNGAKYTKNDNIGTISGATYTVGVGNGDITINASSLTAPVCTMQGGTIKVFNLSDTVLTATSNASRYDSNSVDVTYSFGYATTADGALGNFSTAAASNTFTVAKDSHRSVRHYGVTVVATDKNDNTITNTCTSGTGSSTGTTIANRTSVTLVNARINFDVSNGGSISAGNNPIYVSYESTDLYTTRTGTTQASLPTVTPPTGHSFNGWFTAASGGSKVINADGTLATTAVTNWINSNGEWANNDNTDSASVNVLYAQYTADGYNITLNNNKATTPGSTATNVTYGQTTLGTITNPQRKYTISGWTIPAGNNASGATVNDGTAPGTLTSTYTFNGWYKEAAATNKIASNATTPVLQANTSYTDADGKWTSTSPQTLYAGWTSQAKVLPKIEKTGYTCGWTETSTGATSIQFDSGASLTPAKNYILYGVCIAKQYDITLNQNNATTNSVPTTVKATYDNSALSTSITNPQRSYTISFNSNNTNCSVGNSSLTYTYGFSGWYAATTGNTKVIDTDGTLTASNGYTDANKNWTTTEGKTVYARWTNQSFTMPTSTRKGYNCVWNTSNTGTGTDYTPNTATTSYAPTANSTLYAKATAKTYTINLNGNGATTAGSATATATYDATSLSSITNPQRKYTISGFTLTSSAANASVSSTSTLTSTYTFNGWYKESGATNKIASNATTPALQASTSYTDANNKWTNDGGVTLYAGWSGQSKTLPEITRDGSTCGWSTSPDATTYTYSSKGSLTPSANTVLYGVCVNNISLNRNGGNAGSTSATVNYGATTLSSITVPTRANSTYSVSGFTLTASGANATVASTTTLTSTQTYTFNGWYKESGATNKIADTATTPALQASTTYTNAGKQWTYTTASTVTLYAGWTPSGYSSVKLPKITRAGSTCGWATSNTATSWNYTSEETITPSSNLTLYGVCRNNITLNRNGGNTGSTSTTVAYNATTLGTITNPTRANSTGTRTISGFTMTASGTNAEITWPSSGCTASDNCKSTNTTTYTFNGWHETSGTGTLVASNATTPALQASTTFTDVNGKWTYTTASAVTLYAGWTASAGQYSSVTLPQIKRTGSTCGWATSDTATTWNYASGAALTPTGNVTLYGVCRTDISLNANGGTGGSASTTATYNATTLATITNPTRANSTGTRTVSGFTLSSSATNASVTWPSTGCTATNNCKSTNTTTYTFNGWHKESGATNKIADAATTPALQASTTYTDANSKWTYTAASTVTLYAGWTASAGSYSSITLPQIKRTGSTCGWATSNNNTTWNYDSGASFTPSSATTTLYGVCRTNITLDRNGGNTGSTSTTVNYNDTTLGSITVPTKSNSTGTRTVSGFTLTTSAANASVTYPSTGCTSASNCKSTNTTTYTFNGWYTATSGGTKIADTAATPALQASTTYTDANKKWTYTTAGEITLHAQWNSSAGAYSSLTLPTIERAGSTCGWSTSSTATTIDNNYTSGKTITPSGNITLYGVCVTNITLNRNGGNAGSTSTTVNYGATSLGSITAPTKNSTTGTRTISGFSLTPSATNASVTYPSTGCTSASNCKSTNTTTYTFAGWYKESGLTNQVAGTGNTPALTASNGYTDADKKWNYTTAGTITLYAKWNSSAGAYSSVTLPQIKRTGSTCGWATSDTATSWTYDSGSALTPTGNTTLYGVCRTDISLNANGGTGGSASTTATYNATTLATVSNPTRANSTGTYTISGFTITTAGTNASITWPSTGCKSASNCKSTNTTTYTFNGWYKEAAATNKIASNATTPALQASTTYTDANKKWTYTTAGNITLYAGWTANAGVYSSVTLPQITRTGSTCGWATSDTATSWTYDSGAAFTPTGNTTLYGVCRTDITLANDGATTEGSTSATATYGATSLSAITLPQRKFTVSGFTKTTSATNSTVASTTTLTATSTFNGWYTAASGGTKIASNAATPALQASTTYTNSSKQWTYTTAGAITLHSQWTNGTVKLPKITRTGSTCGWATANNATTWTYNSEETITPTANLTLYGVCRTDISLNANGGTGGSTSTTVNYNATTLGTITNPTRANSTGTRTISGFTMTTAGTNASITWPSTGCTSASNCKSTNTTTYSFAGWYKESGATNKIASNATTPALQASTTYTDANSKWTYTTAGAITLYAGWTASAGSYSSVTLPQITRTGSTCGWATSDTATSWTYDSGSSLTPTENVTLYGVCRTDISLNANGGTGGSTSTTATYGATSLATVTNPTRANSTGTRTVSGFSMTASGANAEITWPSTGCTSASNCKSTNTTTYTFNGWYKESGTTNKIASNATTPALQASTTYTDANKKWTYTTAGAITLYAGWTANAGSYSSVTLPQIKRTGSTCGWATSSTATTWNYASGASLTPTGNVTLYGVCRNNITLNKNNATNSPTTSTTATYGATTLGAIATLPARSYAISGFTLPSGNNADGASITWPSTGCTSASTCTSTYTFNGWHASSGTGTLVASSAATPALQASTTYTDANSKWTYTTASAVTLYAGWTGGSVTLPKIEKAGHTCGWTTTSTGATTITYDSLGSLTPSAATTLYGVCTVNNYNLTITFASDGVSSVQVRTAAGTGGTLIGTVSTNGGSVSGLTYGATYYLYPVFADGYGFDNWAKTSGQGTLSSTTDENPSFTIGAGAGTVALTTKASCAFTEKLFSYTGDIQSWTVPAGCSGKYQLQTWGAAGGGSMYYAGGKGGYSTGEVFLSAGTTIYVAVGGAGTQAGTGASGGGTVIKAGGFNGGGSASTNGDYTTGSGGGATHIGTFNSTLAAHGDTTGLYIVAGGGGGADSDKGYSGGGIGGAGGGSSGQAGQKKQSNATVGGGGTQTSAGSGGSGSFGQGANYAYQKSPGGGGGLYGGGTAENNPAGGGSGYIGGVLNGTTTIGTSTFPSTSGGTETGHSGNGAAKITYQGLAFLFEYSGSPEAWTVPKTGTYKLEVWGAAGGPGITSSRGGYAVGNVSLTKNDTLYVVVGGQGNIIQPDVLNSSVAGGYNGGGAATTGSLTTNIQIGSGGGATHIGTFNSTLADHGNTTGLYIVAGGGGGSCHNGGGDGGGATGNGGESKNSGTGGTQSAGGTTNGTTTGAGSFGQGGSYAIGTPATGGGGGLYGGGAGGYKRYSAYDRVYSAGGGSGYIGGVTDGSMENGVRKGNGMAIIMLVE